MEENKSFRKEQLPDFIGRLKNMVDRNYEIMVKPIENDIAVDKYYNIVKGRKAATEQSIKGLKKIDSCYKELDNLTENEFSSYYRKNIKILIQNLKDTYFLNLAIIDIKLDPNEITEDKMYNVVKSREMAYEDCDWIMTKIQELETVLHTKAEHQTTQSWAKIAAERNK